MEVLSQQILYVLLSIVATLLAPLGVGTSISQLPSLHRRKVMQMMRQVDEDFRKFFSLVKHFDFYAYLFMTIVTGVIFSAYVLYDSLQVSLWVFLFLIVAIDLVNLVVFLLLGISNRYLDNNDQIALLSAKEVLGENFNKEDLSKIEDLSKEVQKEMKKGLKIRLTGLSIFRGQVVLWLGATIILLVLVFSFNFPFSDISTISGFSFNVSTSVSALIGLLMVSKMKADAQESSSKVFAMYMIVQKLDTNSNNFLVDTKYGKKKGVLWSIGKNLALMDMEFLNSDEEKFKVILQSIPWSQIIGIQCYTIQDRKDLKDKVRANAILSLLKMIK